MTTTVDMSTGELAGIAKHTATIDAAALLQGLRAVLPHIEPDGEVAAIHRVRLDFGEDDLELLASSRYTAVIARIDGEGTVESSEPWTIDLLPEDLAVITKMFKPGKDEQITLRIDLRDDDRVTLTDASGLFDGRAYTVPSLGHPEDFPALRFLILSTMDAERGVVGTVTYTGDLLRRFAASAASYDDALHVEPTAENKPLVVTVGDRFVGLLMPRRNEDETTIAQRRVRDEWSLRLR